MGDVRRPLVGDQPNAGSSLLCLGMMTAWGTSFGAAAA
jgi:hypothetical protein